MTHLPPESGGSASGPPTSSGPTTPRPPYPLPTGGSLPTGGHRVPLQQPQPQPQGRPYPGPPRPYDGPLAYHGLPPGHYGPPPVPLAPDGQPLANFGDRFLAFLIDAAVIFAVALVVMLPFYIYMFTLMDDWIRAVDASSSESAGAPPDAEMFALMGQFMLVYAVAFLLILAATYIYRVEMMFRTGQTFGKRVMKLRIIPVNPATPALTRGMAVRRWLVDTIAAQCIPFLNLVDGLWQLWDQPLRQCLHDKVAETVVVKVAG